MKVIAKTGSGYLVEATMGELVNIAGSSSLAGHDFVKETTGSSGYGRDFQLPIGSTINVSERFKVLDAIEKARDRAVSSAAALKGLAELIEKSIPEGLTLPPAPKEDAQ